ncbi:MAG: hypothetical protein OEZ65_17200, partial [Gemmatimonadota bacterium]|nr:hypothetical protein [Gemmatimonadota bacterium]
DAACVLTWIMSATGGFVAAGITGGIVDPEKTMVAVILAAGLGGGLTLARTLWGRSTRAVRARANRLMEVLVREVDGAGRGDAGSE